MKDLSLHILDLAQNSITAGAALVKITVHEDPASDILSIAIEDDGQGMDKELQEKVKDPFTTTRDTRRVGLGIPLMAAACSRCGGELKIESEKGIGTKIIGTFKYSHIDRAPIGNISDTVVSLILAGADPKASVDFIYKHIISKSEFSIDTREIKKILGEDVSLGEPEVLSWIKDYIDEGLANLRGGV